MSWNSPSNWAEIVASVERGFGFNATRHGVRGDTAMAVCGHYSTRAVLSGHLDDMARHIIASNDALHARYIDPANDRYTAERPDDVGYFVTRDGNPLAYVTRAGDLVINERAKIGMPRYADALRRLVPALREQTVRRHAAEAVERANIERDRAERAAWEAADRLEYLRGEIRAERISMSEIAELQGLVPYIAADDVELLEWAGVPESENV